MSRILVVEDQLTTGWLLSRQLAKLGDVRVAANEAEAKANIAWLVGSDDKSVAIVDLSLPVKGVNDPNAGFRVIDEIGRSGAGVPVIVLTIRNDRDGWEKAKARNSVVWFFFTKAWDSERLASDVKAALLRTQPEQTPLNRGHVEGADEN
jgi:DNA-binding response OmpR family regulator